MSHLDAREREAVRMAGEVRALMHSWMVRRGVAVALGVSPYVDAGGRANVLIRVDARLALAMLHTLPDVRVPQRRTDGRFDATS